MPLSDARQLCSRSFFVNFWGGQLTLYGGTHEELFGHHRFNHVLSNKL